jgi:SAM-dependent methyltransferase
VAVAEDRWWRGFDTSIVERVAAHARVLDVGCGDGGLVECLCASGLDAIGVDPRAPPHPRLIPERVEDVGPIGEFDAICAVMALHHASLDGVTSAFCRLLRPSGQLFVYDFAWERYDARAEAWLAVHDHSGADNSVSAWRSEHGELHTGATIRTALTTTVDLREESARPYLARMLGTFDLEAEEQRRIAAGALPALGDWYVGVR